jgi:hypothetical protein
MLLAGDAKAGGRGPGGGEKKGELGESIATRIDLI